MKLIVGLGNPGPEFALTPHNAGFLAIDRLAEQCGTQVTNRRGKALTARVTLAGQDVMLAKPETFMNMSGLSISLLLGQLELTPADLIVLYDELAFPLGQVRLRERGSANGHNGIKSILASLSSQEWARVRIGVGKTADDGRAVRAGGQDYLLAPLRKMLLAELDAGLDLAARAVEKILKDGMGPAMTEFNRKADGTAE